MNGQNVLNSLQIRNNSLKPKLFHEQLKWGNYSFEFQRKYIYLILNEYKRTNSLVKSAELVGIGYEIVFKWYVQGLFGNSYYRGFYLAIRSLNSFSSEDCYLDDVDDRALENDSINDGFEENEYVISKYGDGWSYKTYIDGEKIFFISNDLESLKKKIRDKHLPVD